MEMVQLQKDSVTGLKRRNRHKPFYKSKLVCIIATILFGSIGIWCSRSTSTSSNENTTSVLSTALLRPKSNPSRNTGGSTLQLFDTPECQNGQQRRWSDRFPSRTISTVQSIFNCDLPNATCKYYFPANFFDEDCGIGRDFAQYLDDAESMRKNRTLWINMPSVGFPTLTMDNTCFDSKNSAAKSHRDRLENIRVGNSGARKLFKSGDKSKRRLKSKFDGPPSVRRERGNEENSQSTLSEIGEHILPAEGLRCLTERISFIHVHKSGGTSLHRAFDVINNNQDTANIQRHKWFTPKKSMSGGRGGRVIGGMPQRMEQKMYNFTLESALQATTYPASSFGEFDHTIFAVVRDPTERFISSIGQAMGGEGSQRNIIGATLQKECIKSTSALTLACMARYVRDHSFWIELHFAPQVIDISFTTIMQDIPIAIFPFRELKSILTYLNLPNIQGRNGDRSGYRPDPVLSEMSVEDYDDETLKIVCEIYEVDVIMQRSLGIEVPRCDPFIMAR